MRLFTFLTLTTLLLIGCGKQATTADIAIQDCILLQGNAEDPTDLDPQVVSGLQDYKVLLAVCEGLVSMDPVDLHPVPGVAESWEVSEDGLVYTFHLRSNARWSNGDPITAKDFELSYQRALTPQFASAVAPMFYVVKGAQSFHQGKTTDFSTVGIQALDTHTLVITLTEPIGHFLSLVSHPSWFPVHISTILKHGGLAERNTGWTKPGSYVSNGPFVLESWIPMDRLKVTPNPHYWNHKAVQLKGIHFFPMTRDAEENAFRSGQLHLTESIAPGHHAVLKAKHPKELVESSTFSTYCYAFNTQKAPLNDVRVRKALSMAIERNLLAHKVLQGGKLPAYSFTPPGIGGYEPPFICEDSITKAQSLLAEAGFPGGTGFPKLKLLINTSPLHQVVAEAIQTMWKQHLGIDVEIYNEEWKVFLSSRKAKDFDVVRANWMGDYLDPMAFLEVYTSTNINNHAAFKNTAYDGLVAQANQIQSTYERLEVLRKAETVLLEEAPVMPIAIENTARLQDPRLKGFYPTLLDLHPYHSIYFD